MAFIFLECSRPCGASVVDPRGRHHLCRCGAPLLARYDLPATTRASFYVYNDLDDIERLVEAIHATQRLFKAP